MGVAGTGLMAYKGFDMGVAGTGHMLDRFTFAWGSLVPATWLTKV